MRRRCRCEAAAAAAEEAAAAAAVEVSDAAAAPPIVLSPAEVTGIPKKPKSSRTSWGMRKKS